MADDFFNKDKPEPEATEVEKITVGEKEFTQEELSRLVDLGQIGVESEEKYDTKIDKVWPNLQKTINEKKELEAKYQELDTKLKELEETKITQKADSGVELSQEELKKQALVQAKELGLVTQDTFDEAVKNIVRQEQQGAQILAQTDKTIKAMSKKGYPKVERDDLLEYMRNPDNPANPEKAYKLMFEKEINMARDEKLKGIKPRGMVTGSGSTAGSKTPATSEPITRDNLNEKLTNFFKNS